MPKAKKHIKAKNKFTATWGLVSTGMFLLAFVVMRLTNTLQSEYLFWGEGDFIFNLPTTFFTITINGAYISVIYFLAELIKNVNH